MRDLFHKADLTSCKKISDFEQEIDLSAELKGEYDVLMNKLSIAEAQIEELKQQLDGSMVAEDMLELTEQILTLNEKTDDMKTIIKDLEALKQLADELEDHVKTKQETQEEIHILLWQSIISSFSIFEFFVILTQARFRRFAAPRAKEPKRVTGRICSRSRRHDSVIP